MSTQQNNADIIARKGYLAVVNSEKLKQQMAASLTDSDPAAVRRIVAFMANAAMKTPQLYRCEAQSIMKVMLDCCTLGIEPNGRDAHVIPYRTKNGDIAQLLIDYKGMITLAMKSERIRSIRAEVVCENDLFRWTNGKVEHSIEWKKPRGDMYAVYATALYKDGTEETAVLTKEEVDSVRARSRSGNNGPWVTDYNEMAKKTAVRRLSKYLPLSPSAVAAVEYDNDQYDLDNARVIPVSTAAPKANADELAAALSGGASVVDAEPMAEPADAEPERPNPKKEIRKSDDLGLDVKEPYRDPNE